MLASRGRTLGACAGAMLFAGCSGSTDPDPYNGTNPPPPGGSVTIQLLSGDGQDAQTGTPLAPFRVTVTQGGTPLSGRTVTWAVADGSGSLSSSSTVTGADGVAQTVLTVQDAGVVRVTATSQGATGSPVSFFAFAPVPGLVAVVNVGNDQFTPMNTVINAGGRVFFVYRVGATQHNINPVAPNAVPYQPQTRNGPFVYDAFFPTPGAYDFYCSEHGAPNSGMRGSIVAQ